MQKTKKNLLTKKIGEVSRKKVRRKGQQADKTEDKKSNGSRQKNKREDSKVESNNSPLRVQTGRDIRHPRPHFGETRNDHFSGL